jgi:hypothetical protein
MAARQSRVLTDTLSAALTGFAAGIVFHFFTVYVRDHGPTLGGFSFKGNGATVLLLLALLAVLFGEVFFARRRAWPGMTVLPLAMFLGLFVVFGGV